MSVFAAYYDTSRSETARPTTAIVTTGVLVSETQSARLTAAWNAELQRAGLPYLHMRELSRHFAGRNAERESFLARLTLLLKRRVSKLFFVVVDREDYQEVDRDYRLTEAAFSDFGLCSGTCAVMADLWTRTNLSTQEVRHVHESGDRGIGHGQAFARQYSIELGTAPARDDGGWVVPFMACDFLAWELRRGHEQLYMPAGSTQYDFRPSLGHIATTLRMEGHNFNRTSLRAKCIRDGVARRA